MIRFDGTKAELLAVAEDLLLSRKSFKHFMRRAIIDERGWVWTNVLENLCDEIEAFIDPSQTDKRLLCISILPRAGKSVTLQALSAWLIGRNPRTAENMYISYSQELSRDNLRAVRQIMDSDYFRRVFPRIEFAIDSADGIMVKGRENSKYNLFSAGVGGSITGRGISADGIGCVDDPIRGLEESESPAYKRRLIDWWNGVFVSRMAPGAKAIICQTRFAVDDLCGYIGENFADEARIINYPALIYGDTVSSIMPERFSVDELLFRKKMIGARAFDSLYMGSPSVLDGNLVKREWFDYTGPLPRDAIRVRGWDLASTEGGGDWTVGALIAEKDGMYVVEDIVRVQYSPAKVMELVKNTALRDGPETEIVIEAQPGASGKILSDAFARMLAQFNVRFISPSGSKLVRAEPMIASMENGHFKWVRNQTSDDVEYEFTLFDGSPSSDKRHDDAVDACALAYNRLAEHTADAGGFWVL